MASRYPLPERRLVTGTFHLYKDPLMKLSKSDLPQQREVSSLEHIALFTMVLQNHPNAEGKIGSGIDGFFIRRSMVPRSVGTADADVCCCYVRRTDGTEEDFSIFKCYGTHSYKYDRMRFDSATETMKPDRG